MSKKDIQKQFDYAVGQVIKQGQPAYSVENKDCYYRLKKGNTILKCPIGWLIPDSYFKAHPDDIEDTGVMELDSSVYSQTRMTPFKKNRDILRDLQGAHDDSAIYTGFVDEFKNRAKEVANFHKLKWNFE
jgi:hypothetical protein